MKGIGLLFKVLWSPGEAMFFLAKNPRILTPLLFLSLSSLLTAIAVQTKVRFGELYMNMIARSPQAARMPEEAKAQMQRLMSMPAIQGVFVGSAVVIPLLLVVFVAALYFGLFSMLGREGGFKAFISITAFAFVPMIFSQLAGVVRAFVVVPSSLMLDELGSLSPATFLNRDSTSPMLFSLVNSLDFISIWILILLVIGYGFVSRKGVSKATRTLVVFGVFLLYVGLKLAGVAMQGG
jgi:hypothetical protein